jgi:hypothetical protein
MNQISMEEVAVEGRISGQDVIDDLCDRIAERLSKSCDLRVTDSYGAYTAKVTISLTLEDMGVVEVHEQMIIGSPDATPSEHIVIDADAVSPEQVRERLGLEPAPSLERSVDGNMPEAHSAPAKANKRYYTPRNSAPRR